MIRLAAILGLVASQAAADPVMTQAQCDGAWARGVGLIFGMLPDRLNSLETSQERRKAEAVRSTRTSDGWCRIDAGPAGLDDPGFASVAWRATEIDRFIHGNGVPSRVEARFAGVTLEQGRDYDVVIGVQHEPDQGLLLVDTLRVIPPKGDGITATAVIGGAYFRDIGQAGMSLGGLHLDRLQAVADVSPMLVADLIPELTGAELIEAMSGLGAAQIDRGSRRAVDRFAGDLPTADGQLQVDLRSDRGIGFMQIAMAQTREGAEAVAFALSGASISVDWQPR